MPAPGTLFPTSFFQTHGAGAGSTAPATSAGGRAAAESGRNGAQGGRSTVSAVDWTESAVIALGNTLEAKDFRLRRHSDRVADYAVQIADKMGLPETDKILLRWGSMLHDIGNIGIADSILLKPGDLTDWEFEEVRQHTIIGENICKPIEALQMVLPLIRSHHERLNGSGYPDGLEGDNLPLLVRIVSVADVYDTLRCDRAYRGAFRHEDAMDILEQEVTRGWWQREVVDAIAVISTPRGELPVDLA